MRAEERVGTERGGQRRVVWRPGPRLAAGAGGPRGRDERGGAHEERRHGGHVPHEHGPRHGGEGRGPREDGGPRGRDERGGPDAGEKHCGGPRERDRQTRRGEADGREPAGAADPRDQIALLERRQRELEQRLADVVERLRRLRRPVPEEAVPIALDGRGDGGPDPGSAPVLSVPAEGRGEVPPLGGPDPAGTPGAGRGALTRETGSGPALWDGPDPAAGEPSVGG